jgi:hypothetical protein
MPARRDILAALVVAAIPVVGFTIGWAIEEFSWRGHRFWGWWRGERW